MAKKRKQLTSPSCIGVCICGLRCSEIGDDINWYTERDYIYHHARIIKIAKKCLGFTAEKPYVVGERENFLSEHGIHIVRRSHLVAMKRTYAKYGLMIAYAMTKAKQS